MSGNCPRCGCVGPNLLAPDLGQGTGKFPGGLKDPVRGLRGLPPHAVEPRLLTFAPEPYGPLGANFNPALMGYGCGCEDGPCATDDCACECDSGGTPVVEFSAPPLNRVAAELAKVQSEIQLDIPGTHYGPLAVNPLGGNLLVRLAPPASGPFDPRPVMTYNSAAAGRSIQYGHGVSDLFNQTVHATGSKSAVLIDGTGRSLRYTDLNGEHYYLPGEDALSSLKQTGPGEYLEVRPDGLRLHYECNSLNSLETSAGQTWTIDRDGPLIQTITNPLSEVTTYTYDDDDRLSSIEDPSGRVTTFTIDDDCHLTEVIRPDDTSHQFGYDEHHLLTSYTDPDGHVTTIQYDDCRRVEAVVTPLGHRTTFTYGDDWSAVEDPLGHRTTIMYESECGSRMSAVINPLGQRTTYTWEEGRIATFTDACGHCTTFTYATRSDRAPALSSLSRPVIGAYEFFYDDRDHVESCLDPDGHRTTLTWDDSGNRTEVIDAENRCFTTVNNDRGQVEQEIDPLGHVTEIVYDSDGHREAEINAEGELTTLTYDAHGWLETFQNPLLQVTTLTRDLLNRVTAVSNPCDETTTYTYSDGGSLESVTDPLNHITTYLCDEDHRHIATIDARGNRTTYLYDDRGLRTQTISAELEVTTFLYDAARRQTEVVNPRGLQSEYTYDAVGRQTSVRNPLGQATTTTYDGAGRATRTINPLGHVVTTTYNVMHQVTAVENAEGETTSSFYDDVYRLESTTNPLGFRTTYTYDDAYRPIAVENPEHEVTSTVYDDANRPIEVVNPLGKITTTEYDEAGQATVTVTPLGFRTTTLYDDAGRAEVVINPLGERTTTTYDDASRAIAVENAEQEVTTTDYDPVGNVEAIEDPLGHRTTFTYDKVNRQESRHNAELETSYTEYLPGGLTEVTITPLGFRTTLSYDDADRPRTVTNPELEVTTTVYDAAGRAIATVNPLGFRTTTTYDKADRPIRVQNPELEITTTVYDAAGRKTTVIDPLLHTTEFGYDKADRQETVQNGEGEVTTTVYDPAGRVIATVTPLGYRTTFGYDDDNRRIESVTPTLSPVWDITTTIYDDAGRPTAVLNPRLYRTTTLYDHAGRPELAIDARGYVTTTVYDAAGRVERVINPRGAITTTIYDHANRPIRTIDATLAVTSTVYDDDGRVWQTFDAAGAVTTRIYDKANRVEATITPPAEIGYPGRRTTFTFDLAGRQIAVTDPLLKTSTTVYDKADRVTREITPNRFITRYFYDAAGRKTATLDGNGKTTQFGYDDANRLTVTRNPDGGRVTNVYDLDGRVEEVINERGYRTTTVYDPANRVLQTINPLLQSHYYEYDRAGNRDLRIDARGWRTTYSYDPDNRESLREYEGGAQVEFEYDEVGNRELLADITGRYTATYDALNRVDSVTSPGIFTANYLVYEYYPTGTRKRLVDPDGGTFTTVYNPAGELSSVTNPWSETTSLGYNAGGQNTARTLGNGTVSALTYDPNGNLERIAHATGTATPISGATFDFDGTDNRTGINLDNGQYSNWLYDGLTQLGTDVYFDVGGLARLTLFQWKLLTMTGWATLPLDIAGLFKRAAIYDLTGNREVTVNTADNSRVTMVYDAANRLQTSTDDTGTTTYTYDNNGNQWTVEEPGGDITTNTWDGENRLIQVEHPDSTVVAYFYNGDGLKVFEDDGVEQTLYVYDGNNLLQEQSVYGTVAEFTYVPAPYAQALSQKREGDSSFFHGDGMSNVTVLTDSWQIITDEYTYDAWGLVRNATGTTANSQLFKGELLSYRQDPNAGPDALFALHHRHYASEIGRFTSEDPAADDLNLYRYVGNNPVNVADPSGLGEYDNYSLEQLEAELKWYRELLGIRNSKASPEEQARMQNTVRELEALTAQRKKHGNPANVTQRIHEAESEVINLFGKLSAVDQHLADTSEDRETYLKQKQYLEDEIDQKLYSIGRTWTKNGRKSNLEFTQKLQLAVMYAIESGKIPGEIAEKLEQVNWFAVAGMFALLASVNAAVPPAGVAADITLVGYFGIDTLYRAKRIYSEVDGSYNEAQLRQAGDVIAEEIGSAGAEKLIELLTWGAGRAVGKKLRKDKPKAENAAPKPFAFEEKGISYSSTIEKGVGGETVIEHFITQNGKTQSIGISTISKEGVLSNAFDVPKELQGLGISQRAYSEAAGQGFKSLETSFNAGPNSVNFIEFFKVYDPNKNNAVEALLQTPAGKVASRNYGLRPDPSSIRITNTNISSNWIK